MIEEVLQQFGQNPDHGQEFVQRSTAGQPIDPLLKEFLMLVLSKEGQELVQKDHYLPLTAKTVAEERAKLN